jgi:hypothetical protein
MEVDAGRAVQALDMAYARWVNPWRTRPYSSLRKR